MDTTQLKAVLKTFHWPEYEAAAYCALIEHGPMKANDVAIRATVPQPRIYQVLDELFGRGWIKKSGTRPVIYDAQHPRYVIEFERGRLDELVSQAIRSVEEAWEYRTELGTLQAEKAWTVKGLQGVVTEIRNVISNAQSELLIADSDLGWMTRKDIEVVSSLRRKLTDLTVLTTRRIGDPLIDLLKKSSIEVFQAARLSVGIYIADSSKVFLRLSTPDTGIIIKDSSLAQIMRDLIVEKLDNEGRK